MNVIARLEYELAYYDSAVHRFNHYTTRTPRKAGWRCVPCTSSPWPFTSYLYSPCLSYRRALRQSLATLLWRGGKPMVYRQVCYQCPHNGGLGMPDLESHWLAKKLAFLSRSLTEESVELQGWGGFSQTLRQTLWLRTYVGQGSMQCLLPRVIRHFVSFLGPLTFLDLAEWVSQSLEVIRYQWNSARSECTALLQLGLQSRSGRYA